MVERSTEEKSCSHQGGQQAEREGRSQEGRHIMPLHAMMAPVTHLNQVIIEYGSII